MISGTGEIARVVQEVAIMKTLDHPNIIKLFEARLFFFLFFQVTPRKSCDHVVNLCLCFFGAKIGGRGFWSLVVRFTKETFEDDDYLYLGPTKWDSCWLTDGFLRKQRSRACCETWDEKPSQPFI